MENHTAKHFVLQLGSLISLYVSLGFLLALLFSIINISFPDALDSYWTIESAHSTVRTSIAMLVVFFPVYLYLTRIVNKIRRTEKSGMYLALTKWLIYLSLLVAAGVLLGDLVAVIMAFLEGEITTRFIFKAFTVFFVVGIAFHYYLLDAKGYWLDHEDKSVMYGIGAGLVVLASLAYGFTLIETPAEVREMKLDSQQITDLQQLQWQIQDYSLTNGKLPDTLAALANTPVAEAPEGREPYAYTVTAEGFELCATFARPSSESDNTMFQSSFVQNEKGMIRNPDNWQHESGRVCFERVVNQETSTTTPPQG